MSELRVDKNSILNTETNLVNALQSEYAILLSELHTKERERSRYMKQIKKDLTYQKNKLTAVQQENTKINLQIATVSSLQNKNKDVQKTKKLENLLNNYKRVLENIAKQEQREKHLDNEIAIMENKLATEKYNVIKIQCDALSKYEEAFAKLIRVTNKNTAEEIIETFIENENTIFTNYNYVNECNEKIDKLSQEIVNLKDEKDSFQKYQPDVIEVFHVKMLACEAQYTKYNKAIGKLNNQLLEIENWFPKLAEGIYSLFLDVGCKMNSVIDPLASEEKILAEDKIPLYLSILEQRIDNLLDVLLSTKQTIGENYKNKMAISHYDCINQWDEMNSDQSKEQSYILPPLLGDESEVSSEDSGIDGFLLNTHKVRENKLNYLSAD